MKTKQIIAGYRQEWAIEDNEYFNEDLDSMNYEDCLESANEVLSSKDYVLVDGMSSSWNGSSEVFRIITETTIGDIISTHMLNSIDRIEIDVYEDYVDFANIHHDGTNRYKFAPVNLMDFKKSELLSIIDENEFIEEMGSSPKYKNKQALCCYIEGYIL